ncbi:hypothetical protein Syun_015788 [Stephania yunnanensis]|uniref:Uncharacterized protein n=1 Tax=Stephania yunnanensis TaxID=152371 RepID=A0AAP0JNJ4_9MAGN
MYRSQRESFVIQIRGDHVQGQRVPGAPKLINLSPMKLFHGFRKILMRFVFSLPTSKSSSVSRYKRHGEQPDPPKTSCSSSYHYSPNSHYTEAIADCIEFFNRSSQEGSTTSLVGRKPDLLV